MFEAIKDPDSTLDYRFDWVTWLNGDTIALSTWIVPAGLTLVSETETGAITVVWLSGGTLPQKYKVVNRVTTAGGRTEDRTLIVRVQQK